MKIVAILHRSAGNESVGDMWRETKIFEETTPLLEVFKWANEVVGIEIKYLNNFRGHLEITIAKD